MHNTIVCFLQTHLAAFSVPFLLLEASDAIGGHIHTNSLDGFLLNCSFQIFLTAYLEAHCLLDYPFLHLHPFYSGALVYHAHRFHRIANPFRCSLHALASLSNPIGSLPKKSLINLACLRAASLLLFTPRFSISARLYTISFSSAIIDRFFRPFLASIFFNGRPALVMADRGRQKTGSMMDDGGRWKKVF
uniref:Uncharacterized protein LOC105042615 n=1 Tax=Elaeis guineensis var. tenera TaxID=51953 RepID=A0A6I9R1U7_ELAGV|nr:uncharacterized protein LOC105042615 [Elaeis guineensis]